MNLLEFAYTVAEICDQLDDGVHFVFVVDCENDDVLYLDVDNQSDRLLAEMDQLIVGRSYAAIANRVMWSPSADEPTSDAWFFVAVEKSEAPAMFGVRRRIEDPQWWHLKPTHVPWIGLSTAGGLRAALRDGEPMRLKSATPDNAQALFSLPTKGLVPPVDDRGDI